MPHLLLCCRQGTQCPPSVSIFYVLQDLARGWEYSLTFSDVLAEKIADDILEAA